jgi:23S rRNA pseudouridine1911/1915/1917 synthase
MINRLDRETSGVMLIAKQDGVARELRKVWETRKVRKEYLAIVHGHVPVEQGLVDVPLGRDEASGVAIKDCVRPDGAPSQTEFRVQRRFMREEAAYTVLRLMPRTGRKHQIRIHLADIGHPIVGDKLYGGDENLYLDFAMGRQTEEQRRRLILPNQALHARAVWFTWREHDWTYQAAAENWFVEFAGGLQRD